MNRKSKDPDKANSNSRRSEKSHQSTQSQNLLRIFQPVAHTLSFSCIFSHDIALLISHSQSTVREAFVAVTVPQQNLSGTGITVNKGNIATLSYPQHALISWQRRSMAMWQLKATRPNSQSSRKSATTSLDQSCPVTSMARHSLCSYSSQPKEVSLIHSGLTSGTAVPPHVS